MTKGQKKRAFSVLFKTKAVARVERGELLTHVAKDIGVTSGVLSSWVKKTGQPVKPSKMPPGPVKDAIIFLRHARDTMNPKTKMTRGELLVLLALSTLEGGK
jgi:hypothetical protein